MSRTYRLRPETRRNAIAKAVRAVGQGPYRPRSIQSAKLYRRNPKHRKEA